MNYKHVARNCLETYANTKIDKKWESCAVKWLIAANLIGKMQIFNNFKENK